MYGQRIMDYDSMTVWDLCKTLPFAQSLRQTQILILKILHCIPAVKILVFLDLEQNWTFFKGLILARDYIRKFWRNWRWNLRNISCTSMALSIRWQVHGNKDESGRHFCRKVEPMYPDFSVTYGSGYSLFLPHHTLSHGVYFFDHIYFNR